MSMRIGFFAIEIGKAFVLPTWNCRTLHLPIP